MKICVIKYINIKLTETFIRAHIQELNAQTVGVHGSPPRILGQKESDVLSIKERVYASLLRRMGKGDQAKTRQYRRLLKQVQPDLVLAEYGLTGAKVMDACRQLDLPLIVHFHGYDASRHSVLAEYKQQYLTFFREAAAIIAVSSAMREALIDLGAPANKVYHNPCGVNLELFSSTTPAVNPPTFVAVGRLVEKKAPHLTIQAFARVYESNPSARLRMIGDGPLEGVCRDLIAANGLEDAVTLLGAQPRDIVQQEMEGARAFVQHSVVALDGDSEGTPVAVLEAGASGLPVVSTRHAGIPDVIVNGETGYLVYERDVKGMARHMTKLVEEPEVAAEMGRKNRERIEQHFREERSIGRLADILKSVVNGTLPPPLVPEWAEAQT
jgi:glycosyltransferase involved in cell wall biosynthesis